MLRLGHSFEVEHDPLNFVANLGDHFADASPRKALFRGLMPDAYFKGHAEVHLHIRLRFGKEDPSDLCIVFQRLAGVGNFIGERDDWRLPADSSLGDSEDPWSDEPVFVGVVELTEKAKGTGCKVVPSLVRLRVMNDSLRVICEGFDAPLRICPLFVGIRDGELEAALLRGRVFSACTNGEVVNGEVESAPEVVHSVAEEQSPSHKVRFLSEAQVESVLHAFSLDLGLEGIGVRFPKSTVLWSGSELVFEELEVLACTCDLGARTF
jgi:hypothetical protein